MCFYKEAIVDIGGWCSELPVPLRRAKANMIMDVLREHECVCVIEQELLNGCVVS